MIEIKEVEIKTEKKSKQEIARNMLSKIDIEAIIEYTNLTKEEIEDLM